MNATILLFVTAVAAETVGPVQKVLTLLEDLKQKVIADGEVEADQFAKFSKWCEEESSEKGYSIDTGKSKESDLQAELQQLSADIGKLDADITAVSTSLAHNEQDLAQAKKIRAEEHADFQKNDAELTDAIDQLVR